MPQRLALLAGANPRVFVSGGIVRLYAGNWKVTSQGLVESSLVLERKDSESVVSHIINPDETHEIVGDCTVQIHMGKRGSEETLNAYAELIEYESNSTTISG